MLTNEAISSLVQDAFPSYVCLVNWKDYDNMLLITILGVDGKPKIKPLRINAELASNEPILQGIIETMRFYVEDGGAFFHDVDD